MKGDFTRDTFDPAKHFSRVLMQQGRVTLDADWNEQSSILLHYLRTLARDLIGPYAAPVENPGFVLTVDNSRLLIGAGRYYVDGILVENDAECSYDNQPNYVVPRDDPFLNAFGKPRNGDEFWLYLDVWERHVTAIEDDSIREPALGGPDTCTRSKIVWQVKALSIADVKKATAATVKRLTAKQQDFQQQQKQLKAADVISQRTIQARLDAISAQIDHIGPVFTNGGQDQMPCDVPLGNLVGLSAAAMAARVDPGTRTEDACITLPESKYRGAENQLYRVEIHDGGEAGEATFKWSRDNGSVATAWLSGEGSNLQVASTRGFTEGNWVELSDDNTELLGRPGTLVQLVKVEGGMLSVDPATTLPPIGNYPANPRVRRWDYTSTDAISLAADNAVPIQESPAGATSAQIVWIDLEDGVQIQFSAGGNYRTGDYWLIPARVATGKVEWQGDDLNPQPLPPHGDEHHYAPLGFASWSNQEWQIRSCRCDFEPRSSCYVRAAQAADATGSPIIKPNAPTKGTTTVIATPIAPTEVTTKDIVVAPAKRPAVRRKKPKP
jgi:Family of unknown function (DUF6519)